jgi:hypothetical protein
MRKIFGSKVRVTSIAVVRVAVPAYDSIAASVYSSYSEKAKAAAQFLF